MVDASPGVGRELQAPTCHVVRDHLRQPGLEDGRAACLQVGDLVCIDVDTEHRVAHLREAGTGYQANVTGAEQGDIH